MISLQLGERSISRRACTAKMKYECHTKLPQIAYQTKLPQIASIPKSILVCNLWQFGMTFIRLSRISGMEWWNGTLKWNTGINNLMPKMLLSHYCYLTHHATYVYVIYACRTIVGNINVIVNPNRKFVDHSKELFQIFRQLT